MRHQVVSKLVTNSAIIELVYSYSSTDVFMTSFISERPLSNSEFDIRHIHRYEDTKSKVIYECRYAINNSGLPYVCYYEDHIRNCTLTNSNYKILLNNGNVNGIYSHYANRMELNKLQLKEYMEVCAFINTYSNYYKTTRFFTGITLKEEYMEQLQNGI